MWDPFVRNSFSSQAILTPRPKRPGEPQIFGFVEKAFEDYPKV
jgi:hypothetical protein